MSSPIENDLVREVRRWAPYVNQWIPPDDSLPRPFEGYSLDGGPYPNRLERRLCRLDHQPERSNVEGRGGQASVWMMQCSARPGQACAVKFFSPALYSQAKVIDDLQRRVEGRGPFLDSYGVLDLKGAQIKVATGPDDDGTAWLPIAIAYQAADLTLADALALLDHRHEQLSAKAALHIVERLYDAVVELLHARLSHQDIAPRNVFLLLRSQNGQPLRVPSLKDIEQADFVLGDFGCAVSWDTLPGFGEKCHQAHDVVPTEAASSLAEDLHGLESVTTQLLRRTVDDQSSQIEQLRFLSKQLKNWHEGLKSPSPIPLRIADIEVSHEKFKMGAAVIKADEDEIRRSKHTTGFALNYQKLIAQVASAQTDFWVFGTYLTTLLKSNNPKRHDVNAEDRRVFRHSLKRLLEDDDFQNIQLFFIDPFSPHAILRGHQLGKGSTELMRRSAETALTLRELAGTTRPLKPHVRIRIYDFVPSFFYLRVDDDARMMFFPATRTAVEDDQLVFRASAPQTNFVEHMLNEYARNEVSISLDHYFELPVSVEGIAVSLRYLCLRQVMCQVTCRWFAIQPANGPKWQDGTVGTLIEPVGAFLKNSQFALSHVNADDLSEWTRGERTKRGESSVTPADRLAELIDMKYGENVKSLAGWKLWELNWNAQ